MYGLCRTWAQSSVSAQTNLSIQFIGLLLSSEGTRNYATPILPRENWYFNNSTCLFQLTSVFKCWVLVLGRSNRVARLPYHKRWVPIQALDWVWKNKKCKVLSNRIWTVKIPLLFYDFIPFCFDWSEDFF